VTTQLAVVITGAAVLLAVVGLLTTAAGRRMGLIHWILAGLLEAVLLVQAVVAVVRLVDGHRLTEPATFWAYLATVLLVPVLGALWAWTERSRWAGAQLSVAGAAVAVMIWRLVQVWQATGA
jgi:4-amino-4-deoxy-L-arabinose transferase-like glycosyltransferase